MTREEEIQSQIKMWESAAEVYANDMPDAIKYGDFGGIHHNEHMIEFAQRRIEELEGMLQQLKSA
jgi:hypothetical protein